jgi:hypothetical protein
MAVAGVLMGYLPYHLLARTRWRSFGIFLGGFLSVLVSAALALGQLWLSGVKMPGAIFGISAALFIVSAVLEGAITLTVVRAIERLHPAWVRQPVPLRSSAFALLAACAALLAGIGFLVASQAPDGIEKLAEQTGISSQARNLIATPFADYKWQALGSGWLGKATAGLAGVAAIYVVCIALGRVISKRRAATAGSL